MKKKIMELPHDVVELILERLPVRSLLRIKTVSKRWNATVESQNFKVRHLIHRELQDPDFLVIGDYHTHFRTRTYVVGSSDSIPSLDHLPESGFGIETSYDDVSTSCDGLICIYDYQRSIFMVNPSTRWYRQVPQARLQELMLKSMEQILDECTANPLGFGKDICTGTYKLVWLYNSYEINQEGATTSTCEVFDFNINSWRHVDSSPYWIIDNQSFPTYLDGSLYWFIFEKNTETRKVLSFDCHTEIFQVMLPPLNTGDTRYTSMCNLNNRLCISQEDWLRKEIWLLDHLNKTWEKAYTMHLSSSTKLVPITPPLAIFKKRKLFLLKGRDFVIYDPETTSYAICSSLPTTWVQPYFPSLISII